MRKMNLKDRYIFMTLSWIFCVAVGSLPYILSGTLSNSIDAFFESASGLTTTGASMIQDFGSVPKWVLVYRAFTPWIGGALFLYTILEDRDLEKPALRFYGLFTFVEFAVFKVMGLSFFDSVTLALTTISTGGFSCYADNVNHFSMAVRIVICIFMTIGGLSYFLLIRTLRNEQSIVKSYFKDEETRFYFLVIIIATVLIAMVNGFYTNTTFGHTLFNSWFTVTSIISTTGYAATDYTLWPTFSLMLILFLYFFGGTADSVSGGMKSYRMLIAFRMMKRSFSLRIHKYRVYNVSLNGLEIPADQVIKTLNYIFTFLACFVAGMILISLGGQDFQGAFSLAASSISNTGPSLETAALTDFSKIICTLLMILGRIGFYPVFVLFSRYFWNPNKTN